MKTLLLINNGYPSREYPAYTTWAATIANSLEKAGFLVDLLVIRHADLRITSKLKKYLEYWHSLFTADLASYDALYINYPTHAFPVFWNKTMRLEKAYMHWHGYDLLGGHSRGNYTRNKIMHRILRSVIQKCRHFVPSNFYREILVNKFSVPVQNITISPSGGVNMDIFKPVNMERKNPAWNIGFASGLAYEKGAGMLFDIMLKYKTIEEKINMPVVFNIINYAQDAEELTQKMNAANIPIIVWERMNKSDMYKFHNSIDVLIMTSESESLGLVVLEAMACGKPAVTFDICAFPDFVLPGISGERVELTRDSQTNADNFIAALVKIKNNYAAYNPRSITAGSYSEAAVVETYKKVFGLYD